MIDPRMLRPESLAPSTELVTPAPEFIGGGISGGQIELGDIEPRIIGPSREEYLFNNLASMAQSSLGIMQGVAAMRQAEERLQRIQEEKDRKHDEEMLLDFQKRMNELEQMRLRGEPYMEDYMEDGETRSRALDLNDPEVFYELSLGLYESSLGGLITKRGQTEASGMLTKILGNRDKTTDERITELHARLKRELVRFEDDTYGYTPDAKYNAFQNNTNIQSLIRQIATHRNTPSTVLENVLTETEAYTSRLRLGSHDFIVDMANNLLVGSIGELGNKIPQVVNAIQRSPESGITELSNLVTNLGIPDPEKLLRKLGVIGDESLSIDPTSVLKRLEEAAQPQVLTELYQIMLDHIAEITYPDDPLRQAGFTARVLANLNGQITQQANMLAQMRTQQIRGANAIGLMGERNAYVFNPESSRTPPDNFYRSVPRDEAPKEILNMVADEQGVEGSDFVYNILQRNVRDYLYSHLGTPDVPLNSYEQAYAADYLGVGVQDLVSKTKMYEERDGGIFLSKAGEKFIAKQKKALIHDVVRDPNYTHYAQQELDKRLLGLTPATHTQEDFEKISKELALQTLREYFPVGEYSDDEILTAAGLRTLGVNESLPSVLTDIFETRSQWVENTIREAMNRWDSITRSSGRGENQMPEGWKAFDKEGKILDDWSALTMRIVGKFLDGLRNAGGDEEKISQLIREYRERPYMNDRMMANLFQKAMQVEQRLAIANHLALQRGLLVEDNAPPINISQEDLIDFDSGVLQNFIANPNNIDSNTGRLTEEGRRNLAIYLSSFAFKPEIDPQDAPIMTKFLDSVYTNETYFKINGNETMQGVPTLVMSHIINTLKTLKGLPGSFVSRVNADSLVPRTLTMVDANGEEKQIDLSYNIDHHNNATLQLMNYFSNPSIRSGQIQLSFARLVNEKIGLAGDKLTKDQYQELWRNVGQYVIALLDPSDRANNDRIMSAGNSYNIPQFATDVNFAINNQDIETMLESTLTMLNQFGGIQGESLSFPTDNKEKSEMIRDIIVGAMRVLVANGESMFIPLPRRLVDSYNASLSPIDTQAPLLRAGDTVPLATALSILEGMNDSYLADNNGWWPFGRRFGSAQDRDTDNSEDEMIGHVLGRFLAYGREAVPGQDTNNGLVEFIRTLTTIKGQELSVGTTQSIPGRMHELGTVMALLSSVSVSGGNIPYRVNDATGLNSGRPNNFELPNSWYREDGAPLSLGYGTNFPVMDNTGSWLPWGDNAKKTTRLYNYAHGISTTFLLARPETSTNAGEFSKERVNLVGQMYPQLESLNVHYRQRISDLASQNISNLEFLNRSFGVIREVFPEVPWRKLDEFVYNSEGMPVNDFKRSHRATGYTILTNREGAPDMRRGDTMTITQNGNRQVNIPVSPAMWRLIDLSKVGSQIQRGDTTKDQGPRPAPNVRSPNFRFTP